MSLFSSVFGNLPGVGTAQETYENVFSFSRKELGVVIPAIVDKGATDSGNTPTTELRPGLVMAPITATSKYSNYLSTNTDGTQNAGAILMDGLRMVDLVTAATQDKAVGLLVGGPVQASKLLGLDLNARATMGDSFLFDDDLFGNRFDWQPIAKGANYTVVPATDRNAHFYATAAVTFSLPTTIAPGCKFRFTQTTDNNMVISCASLLISDGSITYSTVTFSTSSHKIGATVEVTASQDQTKWLVMILSTNTATYA